MSRIGFALFIVVVASLLHGCVIPWHTEWDEVVLLHDGRTIPVHRFARTGAVGTDLSTMFDRGVRSEKLSFKHPDTSARITWSGNLFVLPQAIEVVDGRVYVVALMGARAPEFKKHGCPSFRYIAYIYIDGDWREISMSDLPLEISTANIVMDAEWYWNGERRKPPRQLEVRQVFANNKALTWEMSHDGHGAFMQFEIPRTIEDWRYEYKSSREASRYCN